MSVETRGKWTDLIPDTGLKITEVVDQGDSLYTPGIFNILMTGSFGDKAQKNISGKTGFGEAKEFEDGQNVPELSRYKTYTTKIEARNYGGSVDISKNQIEDRDFESELSEMKDLSRSINLSVDKSGVQLLNGGFATTRQVNGYTLTWYNDGNPQFSTVHATVVPGGSTQSNASSTGIKLGHDNLETGRIALNLQQTDNGDPLALSGNVQLVVPLNLGKEARETVNSPLTPETSNNAINVYKGEVTVISTPFLDASNGGSNTAWFLMDPTEHELHQETRQEKRLEMDKNIKNKVVTFTVDARWANFSKDWRGTWASKGDLAAYSS